jgi:hypothetical protein
MASPDHLRVEGVHEHSPVRGLAHVAEVVNPVLQDLTGLLQALLQVVRHPEVLDVREINQGPRDGHLDQAGHLPELRGAVCRDHVALSAPMGQVILPHHATIVDEVVLEEQVDDGRGLRSREGE